MKSISLVAAVFFATLPLAPVMGHQRIGQEPVKVIFNSGDKKVKVVEGFNAINKATTLQCGISAGCLISASATVQFSSGGSFGYLCTFIDGKQANPACGKVTDENAIMNLHQYAVTTYGVHIIQTMVYSYDTCCGPSIVAWETEYTIYAQKYAAATKLN